MNEIPEEILDARNEFRTFEDSDDFWDCIDAYSSSQTILQEFVEDPNSVAKWKIRARNQQEAQSRVFIKKLPDFGELSLDEQIEALCVPTVEPSAFVKVVREDTHLQKTLDCFLTRLKRGVTWQRYIKGLDEFAKKQKTEKTQ